MYVPGPQRNARRLVPAVLAAITLPLAACGGSSTDNAADPAGPPDVDAAKEQAQQFRTAGMPDDWINFGEFYQSVCDTYELGCNGFAVQAVNRTDTDMSSAEEIAAFKNESTNAPMCSDIGIAFGQVAEEEGVLLQYTPDAAADLPAAFKSADGGWVASAVGVISIMTNTDVIPNPPRSFADLLKPEYKGKVSISNPVTSGTGQATVFSSAAALSQSKGEFDLDAAIDYWAEFFQLGQRNEAEYSAASFERGETPIRIAYDFVNIQGADLVKDKGVGVEIVIPEEGGVWQPSATMCNKKTEDPDLAKLVLDHTLSEKGQLAFAQVGARPVLYTLGKLDVPAELKANWLPESQYANVIQYPDDSWPHPSVVAARWENDVLTAGG